MFIVSYTHFEALRVPRTQFVPFMLSISTSIMPHCLSATICSRFISRLDQTVSWPKSHHRRHVLFSNIFVDLQVNCARVINSRWPCRGVSRCLALDGEPRPDILPELRIIVCPMGSRDNKTFATFVRDRGDVGLPIKLIEDVFPAGKVEYDFRTQTGVDHISYDHVPLP